MAYGIVDNGVAADVIVLTLQFRGAFGSLCSLELFHALPDLLLQLQEAGVEEAFGSTVCPGALCSWNSVKCRVQ